MRYATGFTIPIRRMCIHCAIVHAFFVFSLAQAWGQAERPYRSYATQEVHERLLTENPAFSGQLTSMEAHIQSYGMAAPGKTDTIPVVFHIVYALGQAYPTELQVLAQLDSLNADFQHSADTVKTYVLETVQALANRATQAEIFFCLAKTDAGGADFSPIQYVESSTELWDIDDLVKSAAVGGADPKSPSQILNIWVANLKDGLAGYAQMPGGPSSTDGIVIDPKYFVGSTDSFTTKIYYRGKTLTHLIGSYLGLYELWNEKNPCQDDHVSDTPIHNTLNYFAGDISYHISLCDTTYQPEMIMNFMDNTDDEALTMFTQGQKNRMKAVLAPEGPRAGLATGTVYCSPDSLLSPDDRSRMLKSLTSNTPKLRLHPNPTTRVINMDFLVAEPGKVICNVCNMVGAVVWRDEIRLPESFHTFSLDCAAWPEGEYIVTAIFESGAVVTKKFLIAHP